MRMQALQDLGHELMPIDVSPAEVQRKYKNIITRLLKKLGYPSDLAGANGKICQIVQKEVPDILWIDKGLTIKPATLLYVKKKLPDIRIVSYHPDDIRLPYNRPHAYFQSIPLYDVHFTTRAPNVEELQAFGARKVIFGIPSWGYDVSIHRPLQVLEEDRLSLGGKVGFIGDFELDRAQQMLALAQVGIPVRIWGTHWSQWLGKHPNLMVENRPLWANDYARAICSFDIILGFLRKTNRDQHTVRSIEIPACGAFMLAERTAEHLELFAEGKEAEFFGSTGELIEKVRFYLKYEELRRKIAQAGRERCLRSGYDYPSRMNWMLEQVASCCTG